MSKFLILNAGTLKLRFVYDMYVFKDPFPVP